MLEQGVSAWNNWRMREKQVEPDLKAAKLRNKKLCGADLSSRLLAIANPMTTPKIALAGPSETSSLLVFIAYRQGLNEGSVCAGWLHEQLSGRELQAAAAHIAKIKTYYDQRSPAIHDWTQKWKGDLATARAMILICSPGTRHRRAGVDWLYDEIDWWLKYRRTAPILVLSEQNYRSVIPAEVASRWPNAQRVLWSREAPQQEQAAAIERVCEGLILSQSGINYEEINRLRIRNRGLVALAAAALLLGTLALFFARSQREQRKITEQQRNIAEQQRNIAERNLQLIYGPTLQSAVSSFQHGDITEARSLLLGLPQALRGYEWRLLRGLVDQSRESWALPGDIQDFDYSADGRFLAVALPEGRVLVRDNASRTDWEFQADEKHITGTERFADGRTLTATAIAVHRLLFVGPTRLATCGLDGSVRIYDVGRRRLEGTLQPSSSRARDTLITSPDAQWLASSTTEGLVHIWSLAQCCSGNPEIILRIGFPARALTFSADGKSLFVATGMSAEVWDWKAKHFLGDLKASGQVMDLAFLSGVLYGGLDDGSIVSWDLATRKAETVLKPTPERELVDFLKASPDGKRLAIVSDSRVFLWMPGIGRIQNLSGAEEKIAAVRFRAQEQMYEFVSASGRMLRTYDLDRHESRTNLPGNVVSSFDELDVSADGSVVVAYTLNDAGPAFFRIWDCAHDSFRDIPAPYSIPEVAIFPNGTQFVAGWEDGTIRCYRVRDRSVVWSQKAPATVYSLAVSSDSQWLIVGALGFGNGGLKVLKSSNGVPVKTIPGSGVKAISAGDTLAAWGAYVPEATEAAPLFRLFRIPDMNPLLSGPTPESTDAVTVAVLGHYVATVVGDDIRLWDVTGPLRLVWRASTNGRFATSAAFSPDGSRLVVCAGGALTIWNTKSGDLLLRLDAGPENFYSKVRWAGETIYATNRGGVVSVFNGSLQGLQQW